MVFLGWGPLNMWGPRPSNGLAIGGGAAGRLSRDGGIIPASSIMQPLPVNVQFRQIAPMQLDGANNGGLGRGVEQGHSPLGDDDGNGGRAPVKLPHLLNVDMNNNFAKTLSMPNSLPNSLMTTPIDITERKVFKFEGSPFTKKTVILGIGKHSSDGHDRGWMARTRNFGFQEKDTGVLQGLHPTQIGENPVQKTMQNMRRNSLIPGSTDSSDTTRKVDSRKSVHTLYEGAVIRDVLGMVRMPEGVSMTAWLANNFVKIYKEVTMVSSFMLARCCTHASCPLMKAGGHEYLWNDPYKESGERHDSVEMSAPQYIRNVLEVARQRLNDHRVFPQGSNNDFPPAPVFLSLIAPIFRRFFRIYCHFYRHHVVQMEQLGIEMRVRLSCAFCTFFCIEFDILPFAEYDAINPLIKDWLEEVQPGITLEKYVEGRKALLTNANQ